MDQVDNGKDNMDNNNLLIEIHSDLKHLVKNFDSHVNDDKENFAELAKKVDFQQKVVYGGMGILLFVEFVVKLVK